jgi:hypothetical protein
MSAVSMFQLTRCRPWARREALFTQTVPPECLRVLGEDFKPLPEYEQAVTADPLAAGVAHSQAPALV